MYQYLLNFKKFFVRPHDFFLERSRLKNSGALSLFLLLIFPTILFSDLATAATIESAKSGDWNAQDTWVGGKIPSQFDSVIVKHFLTSANSITHSSGTFTMRSGSKISLENNANLVFSNNSQFKAECTSSEPCLIQSNSSGFIRFGGESFISSYVNFESLGSSSQAAIEFLTPTTSFPANLSRLNIANSNFKETGSVVIGDFLSSGGITSSLSLEFIRNTFTQSRGSSNLTVSAITDKDGSIQVSRAIRGNVFEKTVRLLPAKQFSIERNFFHGGLENLSSERWSSFNLNVILW